MRHTRSKVRQRLPLIGYHVDDVNDRFQTIASRISSAELMLKQESDQFAELVLQKLAFREQLGQMLEQALMKERQWLESMTGE